jgi:dihydrofolate reductase/thymidylate synthase
MCVLKRTVARVSPLEGCTTCRYLRGNSLASTALRFEIARSSRRDQPKMKLIPARSDWIAIVAAAGKSPPQSSSISSNVSPNGGGIGFQGQLPWKSLKADMAFFKEITMAPPAPGLQNAVIMGRKTWESIPPKFRPLVGRTNVVVSRSFLNSFTSGKENMKPAERNHTAQTPFQLPEGVIGATSLEDATHWLKTLPNLGHVFVIGGAQVYQEAISSGYVNKVIYTCVGNTPSSMQFDTFFPVLAKSDGWSCEPIPTAKSIEDSSGLTVEFLEYRRSPPTISLTSSSPDAPLPEEGPHVNPEEMQYLQLCRDIMEKGVQRGDRTGTGTLSKFGTQMRFSLRNNVIPLLTTKRTFWRGVAEELLWFISGNTNANVLAAKNIHIWDGNGSREFLDSRGLNHREVGDLGPVYGFQWRHFGAPYIDMHTDYTGQGFDQLADCIAKIKHNPDDRRIILSAWNPCDLDVMALPPCHMFCQFYVANGELSCQMYQRSADMGLGVPFNIASYSLLTHLMAHVCGLKPGEFIHTIGDAHIYLNHVDALKAQLERNPRAFPKIKINPNKTDIDSFVYEDLELVDYFPHKPIKMDMAV